MIHSRRIWIHVLLSLVTISLYQLYWFYLIARDLRQLGMLEKNPLLLTSLLFVPLAYIYTQIKIGSKQRKIWPATGTV